MVKDYLHDYKKEVKDKYEIEKTGNHSSLLINPSRANLRKLCLEIFKNNTNSDDLKSFSSFFGFEFNPNNTNKLKEQTDKFRPIGSFFKGETDLADIEAVNLAAILVNFEKRPYLKYVKADFGNSSEKLDLEITKEENTENKTKHQASNIIPENFIESALIEIAIKDKNDNNKKETTKNKLLLIVSSLLISFLVFLGITTFIEKKDCMLWKENHYEAATKEEAAKESNGDITFITDENKHLLTDFRKIEPCDTTKYFKNGKACIWRGKSTEGEYEYFTAPGFHPITGKPLREITPYMIKTHLSGKSDK
ncbi:hypothetical protein [Flavobacterium sp.]|uniref:hypothetical protein n=1 Tax=Flavobacterium sp. TaxID=239 RepID=UPI003D6AE94D